MKKIPVLIQSLNSRQISMFVFHRNSLVEKFLAKSLTVIRSENFNHAKKTSPPSDIDHVHPPSSLLPSNPNSHHLFLSDLYRFPSPLSPFPLSDLVQRPLSSFSHHSNPNPISLSLSPLLPLPLSFSLPSNLSFLLQLPFSPFPFSPLSPLPSRPPPISCKVTVFLPSALYLDFNHCLRI